MQIKCVVVVVVVVVVVYIFNGRKYECNERFKPKMPVSKCKRSKQNIQTPVSISVATQTKTTVYLSARMLLYKFMHISVEK